MSHDYRWYAVGTILSRPLAFLNFFNLGSSQLNATPGIRHQGLHSFNIKYALIPRIFRIVPLIRWSDEAVKCSSVLCDTLGSDHSTKRSCRQWFYRVVRCWMQYNLRPENLTPLRRWTFILKWLHVRTMAMTHVIMFWGKGSHNASHHTYEKVGLLLCIL